MNSVELVLHRVLPVRLVSDLVCEHSTNQGSDLAVRPVQASSLYLRFFGKSGYWIELGAEKEELGKRTRFS